MQGTYLVVQAATKMMVERKVSNGSIINMSSILAKVKALIIIACSALLLPYQDNIIAASIYTRFSFTDRR